jgi:hypothetical protein
MYHGPMPWGGREEWASRRVASETPRSTIVPSALKPDTSSDGSMRGRGRAVEGLCGLLVDDDGEVRLDRAPTV